MARLREAADPVRAAGARRYFKKHDAVSVFGVKVPDVRALAGELYREVKGSWRVGEAAAFCELLGQERHLEAKLVGVLLLGRYRSDFPLPLLARARRWIAAGRYDCWAAIDALAPEVLTPLVVRYPDMGGQVAGWVRARNMWVRRAAAVTFVPLARRGARLDLAYAAAEGLLDDPEDLIHKATGWLLREAGKTDRARLERFLLQWGPRIPRTALRYAIEHFPERRRRQLLAETRAP
jgi:3-methyladenine DNA glycosylase AlkD